MLDHYKLVQDSHEDIKNYIFLQYMIQIEIKYNDNLI